MIHTHARWPRVAASAEYAFLLGFACCGGLRGLRSCECAAYKSHAPRVLKISIINVHKCNMGRVNTHTHIQPGSRHSRVCMRPCSSNYPRETSVGSVSAPPPGGAARLRITPHLHATAQSADGTKNWNRSQRACRPSPHALTSSDGTRERAGRCMQRSTAYASGARSPRGTTTMTRLDGGRHAAVRSARPTER